MTMNVAVESRPAQPYVPIRRTIAMQTFPEVAAQGLRFDQPAPYVMSPCSTYSPSRIRVRVGRSVSNQPGMHLLDTTFTIEPRRRECVGPVTR